VGKNYHTILVRTSRHGKVDSVSSTNCIR